MSRAEIDKQSLRELIDNRVNNGNKIITYDEAESLLEVPPKARYRIIYTWYKRGTSFIASLMSKGYKWKGSFKEAQRMGYRFLKPNYDHKTKTGYYTIITNEKKHDNYETSNENLLEIKLKNKYQLTEDMQIERERRFVQLKLEELVSKSKKKKKRKKNDSVDQS